jgi:hypothetical protein
VAPIISFVWLVVPLETITVTLSFKHADLPNTVQPKQLPPTFERD